MDSFIQIILIGLFGTTQPALLPYKTDAIWNCQDQQWVGTHDVDDDGIYSGTLAAECTATVPTGGQITKLKEYLIADLSKQDKSIHEGPVPETYAGLPSVRYDVTLEIPNDGSPMSIRADAHYASDDKNHLVYASESKEIDASGMASYLQKITEGADVILDGQTLKFKVTSSIAVKKPWYAPTGTFISQTESAFISNFKKGRDERVPDWAEHL